MTPHTVRTGVDPAKYIEAIALSLEIDPDDLVIEIRKDGRTSVVAYVGQERILLAMLRGFDELRPYVEGLVTPRKIPVNVTHNDDARTTEARP